MIYENCLKKYCQEQGITMEELSKITTVSVPQLYLIDKFPKYNVKIDTINRIYAGTEKKFGAGLPAYQYLDFSCLRKAKYEDDEDIRLREEEKDKIRTNNNI